MPKATKQDVLSFLEGGESYQLPNGQQLALNHPTVKDLVEFQKKAREVEDGADATQLPLFLLGCVTNEYGFDQDQLLTLLAKTGGMQGGLAKKVNELFGLQGVGDAGEVDEDLPTG